MTSNKKRLASVLVIALMSISSMTSCANRKANDQSTAQPQHALNTKNMKKILIIGMNPHTIDFTNPELPPGLTIDIIEQGTNATVEKLTSMGYQTELFLVETGATDFSDLANQLHEKKYDGIVVGNGIRGIKANFILFEKMINDIHTFAPKAKIIFNALPTDTDEAVRRWL